MQSAALSLFFPLSKRFEGYVPWMYLDVEGLVTTGMGNLINSVGAAQQLPWQHGEGGSLATPDEIASAWNGVKASQDKSQLGGGNVYWQNLNDLRLDDAGVQQLISSKVDNNNSILQSRFPAVDTWPAPAQLAIMLMAWAMGPNFKYPNFQNAVNSVVPDFDGAADQAYMPDNPEKSMDYPPSTNPGLRPRNIAVKLLFQMAERMQNNGDDYSDIDTSQLGDLSDAALSLAASLNQASGDIVKHEFGKVGVIVGFVSGVITLAATAFAGYKWFTERNQ
jgi:hypothetical protein